MPTILIGPFNTITVDMVPAGTVDIGIGTLSSVGPTGLAQGEDVLTFDGEPVTFDGELVTFNGLAA